MNPGKPLDDGTPDSFPLKLTLQGRGEDTLRMERRLRCAARATGIPIVLDWQASGSLESGVFFEGNPVIEGLMRTEDIETVLRTLRRSRSASS